MATLRSEAPADVLALRRLHVAAFPTPLEAQLVEELRQRGEARISLIAETAGQVVGHILFSPVTLNGQQVAGLGLAPLAVHPDYQRQGIGSQLVRAGLERCRDRGAAMVVVLGEPTYYGRFGFVPARHSHLKSVYGMRDAFQIIVWDASILPAQGGLIRYASAFAPFDP